VTHELGQGDIERLSSFLTTPGGLNLPTQQQVAVAEPEVFAERYTARD